MPPCPGCTADVDALTRRGLCEACDGDLLEAARQAGFPVDTVHGRRFMARANLAGPVPEHAPDLGPCWLWTGAITSEGYGLFRVDSTTLASTHTLAYEWVNGPVPDGQVVDHRCCERGFCPGGKCLHRACFNPAHTRATTVLANTLRGNGPTAVNARKTRCVADHPLWGDNLYLHPTRGTRHCRACQARRVREAADRAAQATLRAGKLRQVGAVAVEVTARAGALDARSYSQS